MRRLALILGFVLVSVLPLYGVAGCGPGTDNSECGNVGDPYEGEVFDPTGKTALAACLNPMTASTSYYLTGDVGADSAAICFGIRNGDTLDLRGYTVTGRIDETGLNANGITIFNGTVNCNISPVPPACIKISSSNSYTAKTRLHHLTVHNASDPGAAAQATILFDWSGLDGTNTAIEVDHTTCYIGTSASATRNDCLRLTSQKKADVHNNDFTCNADTMACNGIEAISTADGYVNSTIHNNKLTITTNTVSNGVPRALLLNGKDSSSVGSQGWQVYSNYCTANNGRCFRFRQVNDILIHDNEVVNCAATASYGCYYFADPSNGTEYVGDAQANIYNETIHLDTGGVAFWLRDGSGWTVKNSTVTGTHGKLASILTPIQAPPGGPVATEATFCGVAGAAGLDTSSTVAASTTVHHYLAGTWTGAGTIDAMGSCPGVGGTPLALLTPLAGPFVAREVGTTSGVKPATLSNPGDAVLTITSIAVSGDFAQTNDCGASLAALGTCTISVTFTPTAGDARTGTLTVTDDAADSPQTAALSGTGLIILTLRNGTFHGMSKD